MAKLKYYQMYAAVQLEKWKKIIKQWIETLTDKIFLKLIEGMFCIKNFMCDVL